MSFRSREYYKESDWDKTGIEVAFWNGHERSDLIIRTIIVVMMLVDIISLIRSIAITPTTLKFFFLFVIILLMIATVPFRRNLTVLHLEYKRIDVYTFKSIRPFRPHLLKEESVYLKDFKSASLSRVKARLSPFWQLKLKFEDPGKTIKIPFRNKLPFKIHKYLYYALKLKASDDIDTSISALLKFYPYFEFKDMYKPVDYRYMIMMSCLLTYFVFSMILPFII